MTGYSPTHIGIPRNHADFERKSVVLFRDVLGDPSIKRLGRSGQRQYGIDLIGYRKGDTKRPVGIQCKQKSPGKRLTAAEVRQEVRKALKYKPPLTEYIIATTAPDDTNLDRLAQKFTREQRDKGRRIRIEVWGWGTLEERIDEYPVSKNAFDPGWSPTVEEQQAQLQKIAATQSTQATRAQVEDIRQQLERQASFQEDLLPQSFADDVLKAEFLRITRRRGFAEAKTPEELAALSQRILAGDLAKASKGLRAEVLERAARSHITPESIDKARFFYAEAVKSDPKLDSSLYYALLPAAEGRTDETLRALRQLGTPEARGAIFTHLVLREGGEKALDWLKTAGFGIGDLDPRGALNLLLQRIEQKQFDIGLQEAESLPIETVKKFPAFRSLRANFFLAAALPVDQKHIPFVSMPLNPRVLQFASTADTLVKIARALADFEAIYDVTDQLDLSGLRPFLEELVLWLKFEHAATKDAARLQVTDEIKNPEKTLRRVRLALAYKVPFNQEALARHLEAQRAVGKWTEDEQFAAFMLAWHNEDRAKLAEFFDQYRTELFSRPQLSLDTLAGIEIEALSRVGRFVDAKNRLVEHRGKHLSESEADQLAVLISSLEDGNEAERIRKLYEESKDPVHLRLLVSALMGDGDHRQLSIFAPLLLKITSRVEDYEISQKSLFAERQYDEVVSLSEEYPELHKLKDDFRAFEGWALFHLGRILDARNIARDLVGRRNDSNDRELDINTTVESGDWGYLQSIVTREVKRISELDARSLIRLSRLAFECGSPYVDQFRDAAIAAAPDKPEPYLSAYQLSINRGDEYQGSQSHAWLQKAIELSGPSGPIQQASLKDILDRAPGWNKKVNDVDAMISEAQIPLYLAARALNRQPVEFILGLALRNAQTNDPRSQYPVLAFSGSRHPVDLSGVRRLALDITTIFTLDFLGLLQKTLDAFDNVVIAPSTLSSLFFDRQFIRFRQPSEVTKAKQIKRLITSGKLKVVKTKSSDAVAVSSQIDPDLQVILDLATETGAVVVRSAPVFKLRSMLEEVADISNYSSVLADTHAVLRFLKSKVPAATATSADAYLHQVDKGWPSASAINAKSRVYLDDLSVTYLHHVGLLDTLTNSVAEVYVPADVEGRCDAIARSEALSDDLLASIDRISTTLRAGIENARGNVVFSARRERPKPQDGEEDEFGSSFPSLDILSNVAVADAVACDDRFLNKEGSWSDTANRIACVTSLDIIAALNGRAIISEQQSFGLLHRLREGGYYAVPISPTELLGELGRAVIDDGILQETPELTAIRSNLTIALRSRVFRESETRWLDQVRLVIHETLRAVWQGDGSPDSMAALGDWLLAALPTPISWLGKPTDEASWALAAQRTAGQLGMFLVPPFSRLQRQQLYGSWITQRLAEPYRVHHQWLFEQAVHTLVHFLGGLLKDDDRLSLDIREALVSRAINSLPPQMKKEVFEFENVADILHIKLKETMTLNGNFVAEITSFTKCLQAAVNGRKTADIILDTGKRAKAKLALKGAGIVEVTVAGKKFLFRDVDVLSSRQEIRVNALARIFARRPLLEAEESHWSRLCQSTPLSPHQFGEFTNTLRHTPEEFSEWIAVPKTLGPANMVPTELGYYERLAGPVARSSFQDYLAGDLRQHQQAMLTKGFIGLRRIAFSALSQNVVPFDDFDRIGLKDVAKLIDAADPFSLVFGVEACGYYVAKGVKEARGLGKKFLDKLFKDSKQTRRRCEIFSACAVVTAVALRSIVDPSTQLYWFRLAVLSHAGVLSDALQAMPNSQRFFKWSAEHLGPSFVWETAIDGREEPRWDSDWMDPDAIKAELVSRCFNVIGKLPAGRKPAAWISIVDKQLGGLAHKLHAFYPGPLDGFMPKAPIDHKSKDYKKLKSILKRRTSFKKAPGLIAIAYSGGIDTSLTGEVKRMLDGSDQQLTSVSSAGTILRCCAYVAATTRNEELASEVVLRCLRLVTAETSPGHVTTLMLLAIKACAAHAEPEKYYDEIRAVTAKFAFLISAETAVAVRSVLEVLGYRDPRLLSATAQAMAILGTIAVSA